MLSITKINSANKQSQQSGRPVGSYSKYLTAEELAAHASFAEYARGEDLDSPAPFWTGKGAEAFGLGDKVLAEHVERLSKGFHPKTGDLLVKGAGDQHVQGVDLTFSACKDVSLVFAAADAKTQAQIIEALQQSAKTAMAYAEAGTLTRHGHAGAVKQFAEATMAACYTHFASRALDPQLHVHCFMFNLGKRQDCNEWSAVEQAGLFDKKMAMGILFRVELASRLSALGFSIEPEAGNFTITGITTEQRLAASTRSREIAEYIEQNPDQVGLNGAKGKKRAALQTRAAKVEPPLRELLSTFKKQAADLGIDIKEMQRTPFVSPPQSTMGSAAVAPAPSSSLPTGAAAPPGSLLTSPSEPIEMRQLVLSVRQEMASSHETVVALTSVPLQASDPTPFPAAVAVSAVAPIFALDDEFILEQLMLSQSSATADHALAKICELAMGHWTADQCLARLDRLLLSDHVIRLGATDYLAPVFTSAARRDLEQDINARVRDRAHERTHHLEETAVHARFDRLQSEMADKLGVPVSLDQQRAAALHVACETGGHAFVQGWAGTGKTTLLKALSEAYAEAGFRVVGCAQSAAAAQNLARETGIRSTTIASLLLAVESGKKKLGPKTILVLDEAGMVGSREFALLQDATRSKVEGVADAKLVCVGDSKQLQPIEGGGIFASLSREHGSAEISVIQRQRTDFAPLTTWLESQVRAGHGLTMKQVRALDTVPEDQRVQAAKSLCTGTGTGTGTGNARLIHGFEQWRERFDYSWMRAVVNDMATGKAKAGLQALDDKGRLHLCDGPTDTLAQLVQHWMDDPTPLAGKTIIAATRSATAELNRLARNELITAGVVLDTAGVDTFIQHRDETVSRARFAPGDRIVFTKNDARLGVKNGVVGTVKSIEPGLASPIGATMDTLAAVKDDASTNSGRLVVELDDPNDRNSRRVVVPLAFGWFDHALCLTNHKSQGRTVDSAFVLVEPNMAGREWSYVALSRSRFSTSVFVDQTEITPNDPDTHLEKRADAPDRQELLDALASRLQRSQAKGTTLDFVLPVPVPPSPPLPPLSPSPSSVLEPLWDTSAMPVDREANPSRTVAASRASLPHSVVRTPVHDPRHPRLAVSERVARSTQCHRVERQTQPITNQNGAHPSGGAPGKTAFGGLGAGGANAPLPVVTADHALDRPAPQALGAPLRR